MAYLKLIIRRIQLRINSIDYNVWRIMKLHFAIYEVNIMRLLCDLRGCLHSVLSVADFYRICLYTAVLTYYTNRHTIY